MTAKRAVNFEFPLSQLHEALSYIAANGLIEPIGLHLHATAQSEGDDAPQCCATAWTKATDEQWYAYCDVFAQDCVAIVGKNWTDTRLINGENFLDLFDAKTVGPEPWPFNGLYFVVPSAPRHVEY